MLHIIVIQIYISLDESRFFMRDVYYNANLKLNNVAEFKWYIKLKKFETRFEVCSFADVMW